MMSSIANDDLALRPFRARFWGNHCVPGFRAVRYTPG